MIPTGENALWQNLWIPYNDRKPEDGQHCWIWIPDNGQDPPHWTDASYVSDPELIDMLGKDKPYWSFECASASAEIASHWAAYYLSDLTGDDSCAWNAKAPFPPNSPEAAQ